MDNNYYNNMNQNQNQSTQNNQNGYNPYNSNSQGQTYQNTSYNAYNPYQQPTGGSAPRKPRRRSGFGATIGKCAAVALVFGLVAELTGYIDSVKNPYLNQLLHRFFDNQTFADRFKFHSAAKSVHHGFVGGLLEHTVSVTRNCNYFAQNYPFLNRDLLITAAIFHDIGKLKELSAFPANDYTDAGQLLGHIMIGAEWVGEGIRSIEGFPVVLENELKHCILAHHGELEYGSPKKPALVEAMALSFADNVDAKMETMREILANVPDNNLEWQGYSRLLETNIRKTSK